MADRSFPVAVAPAVLKWAYTSAGLDVAQLAERLRISENTIVEWELRKKRPTLIQLRRMAKVCKRPLAALLLAEPPREPPLPQDFRTLPSAGEHPLDFKTRLAIRRARRLQALAKEMQDGSSRHAFAHIRKCQLFDDPESVAARVRQQLGVSVETQRHWAHENVAQEEWIKTTGELGVLVFRQTFPIGDARAFSLGDDEFPAIVLNTSDSAHGRIFSLFHELAHLLLDRPGICSWEVGLRNEGGSIESYCNRFAGALLVPNEALLADQLVQGSYVPDQWPEDVLGGLARAFKVSREVILRRLLILDRTNKEFYENKRAEWQRQADRAKYRRQPSPAKRCIRDNGVLFVSLTLDAHRRGDITYVDVADYLGTRFRHIPAVEQMLSARR